MVINEHIIPRFYQKYWQCSRDVFLWCLEKKYSHQGVRQRPISKNCCEKYVYEADQYHPNNVFEKAYSEYETKYAPFYADLVHMCTNCSLQIKKHWMLFARMKELRNERNEIPTFRSIDCTVK